MPSNRCKQCNEPMVEIDHWGERLTGCYNCNRWQASNGEWCRLAPDDIMHVRSMPKRKPRPCGAKWEKGTGEASRSNLVLSDSGWFDPMTGSADSFCPWLSPLTAAMSFAQ
jgi:hypothetical protein